MKDFGKYLKNLRLMQRLTLREVENKTGVSNAYISQIERGIRRAPSPQILKKIAPLYKVTVKELLEAAGYLEKKELSFEDNLKYDQDAQTIFRGYEKLSHGAREQLKNYIRFLEQGEKTKEKKTK